MSPSVEFSHVTVRHDGHTLLDRISFELEAGQGLAIVAAPSTSSALVQLIAGLRPPDAGRILLAGTSPTYARHRGLVGFAPFPDLLDRSRTGAQLLQEIARLKGMTRRVAKAESAHWIEVLDLEALSSCPFGSWPAGEQTTLCLAAALLGSPPILALDSMLGTLNSLLQTRVVACLQTLKEQGASLVVSDPDCEIALAVCDSLALLSDGTLLGRGSLEEVRAGARGLLYAYTVHAPNGPRPEWEHVTITRTAGGIDILAEHDLTRTLVERFGAGAVLERSPSLREACDWMLRHPRQITARSRLWGHEGE